MEAHSGVVGAPGLGLVLALEGSTRRASVAARFKGRSVEAALESARAHQSDLMPAVDALVRELGATPSDLSAVLVGTGPGSYTGLRVTIATALGLARAAGARVLGVPSGEIACRGECADGEELALLLDARSGELYFGRYKRVGDEVEPVTELRVVKPEQIGELNLAGAHVITDAPTLLDVETLARVRVDAVPRASALLDLGCDRLERGFSTDPARLEPLYLRPFAASERKR